jgi:hypothetical protein
VRRTKKSLTAPEGELSFLGVGQRNKAHVHDKKEVAMAEEKTSQKSSQSSQSQQFTNPWNQFMDEQVRQANSFFGELDRLANENLERAQSAVDEMAKLTKESFSYGAKLAAEWRRMGLEAARRTSDTFSQTKL